jgi:hypothetical protein
MSKLLFEKSDSVHDNEDGEVLESRMERAQSSSATSSSSSYALFDLVERDSDSRVDRRAPDHRNSDDESDDHDDGQIY